MPHQNVRRTALQPHPECPRSYAGAATSAQSTSASGRGPPRPAAARTQSDEAEWFWSARKCLRFFPIEGKEENQMRASLDEFVSKKLKIPSGQLTSSDIGFVRRVRSTKRTKTKDEVLVSFTTVAARDLVQSYARNLAEWTDEDNKPLAGIRMEIPERLIGDFKALEQYGHAMKAKHKAGFRRHVKIDDSLKCLYIDVFIPKTKQWVRVDIEAVREDNKERVSRKTKKTAKKYLSTYGSESEAEEMEDK